MTVAKGLAADRVPVADIARLVSETGPTPLHVQIADGMRELINRQAWGNNGRLPSEPDLAAALGVSRGTLRRAIQTLVDEGLLVQSHGKGTFVTSPQTDQFPVHRLISIAEEMDLRHVEFATEVLCVRSGRPPKAVGRELGLEADTRCYRLERVRRVEKHPVAYLVNYVRQDLCPGLDRFDFRTHRLFDVIEREYGLTIDAGHRTFEAQVAEGRVAERLEVTPGRPILYISQVVYLADGEPVECSDVWTPGDRMRLSAAMSRH